MREVGSLSIKLEYELPRVQGVRLCIPLLAFDEHLTKFSRFENLPAGNYDASLLIFLTNGGETKQSVKITILPHQDNPHQFNLTALEQEVVIRPVDSKDRTVLTAEIKVENVDVNFRPVRDWKGLVCKLRPGDYNVKVVLPNLETKSFPLQIVGGVTNYSLVVEEKPASTRRELRFPASIPVDYRTSEGFWISTRSINLSSMGICLVKKPLYMENRNIYIRLFVPASVAPLECPARIRWEKEEDMSKMGVELFPTNTMKASLNDWLAVSANQH